MKQGIVWLVAIVLLLAACGGQENANTPVGEPEKPMSAGQRLFINNCVQCHSISKDKTGPMLKGVLERWHNDTTHIIAFVKNSSEIIGKDDYAKKLFKKWNQTSMPIFSNLGDAEIRSIIEYIAKGEE